MRWRSHILLGLAVAFLAIAPALFGTFTITLMNYIGIYAFAALRACCPCSECNPDGPPAILPD